MGDILDGFFKNSNAISCNHDIHQTEDIPNDTCNIKVPEESVSNIADNLPDITGDPCIDTNMLINRYVRQLAESVPTQPNIVNYHIHSLTMTVNYGTLTNINHADAVEVDNEQHITNTHHTTENYSNTTNEHDFGIGPDGRTDEQRESWRRFVRANSV